MSWEKSKPSDVLWGARKEVLTANSFLETVMDMYDPTHEERDEIYNYGHNFEVNGVDFTLVEMLYEVSCKLGRANSAMLALERHLSDIEHEEEKDGEAHAADLPDAE